MGVLPFPEREEDDFAYLAVQYKVEGAAPEILCQWNCDVSTALNVEHKLTLASRWLHLRAEWTMRDYGRC